MWFGKPSDERDFSDKWHIWSLIELLWSERGYFGILGNTHILFIILLYPLKRYVYKVKTMDMKDFSGTMVSVEYAIVAISVVFILQYKILG